MRVFKHPNFSDNWKCLICKTNNDKEVVLVKSKYTENSYVVECSQYHLDCIELEEFSDDNVKFLVSQSFWND